MESRPSSHIVRIKVGIMRSRIGRTGFGERAEGPGDRGKVEPAEAVKLGAQELRAGAESRGARAARNGKKGKDGNDGKNVAALAVARSGRRGRRPSLGRSRE